MRVAGITKKINRFQTAFGGGLFFPRSDSATHCLVYNNYRRSDFERNIAKQNQTKNKSKLQYEAAHFLKIIMYRFYLTHSQIVHLDTVYLHKDGLIL